MPDLFLLSGPSAAGKSTIAGLLARHFARGAHVEGDVYRRMIGSGREEMTAAPTGEALAQLALRYRLGAQAAEAYHAAGFTTILEDFIAGPMLADVVGMLMVRPLHVIVLLPGERIVARRDATRGGGGYERWDVAGVIRLFSEETPRIGLWLDTSDQTPEETIDEILRRADEARI